MKKIISIVSLVAVVFSMCSMSAFAALPHTLTMACSDADNAAVQNDEFTVTASINTTAGLRAIQAQIIFDPADIEVGMSQEAKDLYPDYDPEGDYETFDDFCINEGEGCASYVDTEYYSEYANLKSSAKFGDPTIAYETREDGKTYVTFAYAKGGSTAVSSSNAKTDFAIAGVVLKVKTAEKKQTTITVIGKGNGTDMEVTESTVVNSITLNLNGYVPGPDPVLDPITVKEADNGATVLEYADDYAGEKTLEGKYVVMGEVADAGAINKNSRVVVTYTDTDDLGLSKSVEYGKSIFEYLKLDDSEGTVTSKAIKFGIVYEDARYKAANFSFEIK